MGNINFRVGDCVNVFEQEADASFDSFVCDPPSAMNFMGRTWDHDRGGRGPWTAYWTERYRLMRQKMKPGAYALIWAIPRTSHWTACAIEDAGLYIQDCITHVNGQGWPKGKSALKPASEHWILARNGSGGALQIDAARVARGEPIAAHHGTAKAIARGTFADPCQPGDAGKITQSAGSWPPNFALGHCSSCEERGTRRVKGANATTGVWRGGGKLYGDHRAPADAVAYNDPDGLETVPAFDCLAACDCGLSRLATAGGQAPRCACGAAMWWCCPVAEMDAQSSAKGMHSAGGRAECGSMNNTAPIGYGGSMVAASFRHGDTENGSAASRFFPRFAYQAKAAGGERHAGCEDLYWRADRTNPFGFVRVTRAEWETLPDGERAQGNVHPTVKSLDLMRWLVALVTPPGGRCGDITAGSGGTGLAIHMLNQAACLTGAAPMSFLGADICPEAVEIAEARLAWWRAARHDAKPKKPMEKPVTGQVSIFDVLP